MRTIGLVLTGIALVAPSRGDEFSIPTASGSIRVTTTLSLDSKGHAHLIADAKNNSGLAIQSATICVSSPSYKKGCLFTLWTTHEWGGDEELDFTPPAVRVASAKHSVTVLHLQQSVPPPPRAPSQFDTIRKIFVDELGGNTGPTLRDHVIANLVNRGRFVAVENPGLSDAVIRGRSDSREQATKVTSAGKGSAGAVFGTVIAGTQSTSVSQTVVNETISLRLTLPSGEVIWAWDETKPCAADLLKPEFSTFNKARCAVQELTALAGK